MMGSGNLGETTWFFEFRLGDLVQMIFTVCSSVLNDFKEQEHVVKTLGENFHVLYSE